MENINLLLSDARGVYIPRDFVQGFDLSKWKGIRSDDAKICENPENQWYWDAWTSILDNATYTHEDGRIFRLHQNGDLWAICYEQMSEEEKTNFGFEY